MPHRCRDIKATACSAAPPHSLPCHHRRNRKKRTLPPPPHPQRQHSIFCTPSPPFPPCCCLGCASQPAGSGRVCVCVCVRSRVLPLSARKQCFDENRKDSCFLFFFSLESLSVSLSVSPVLSNEAVVQLCDGLFANFFFLECGLQKWGCEGEGAQKAAVLFLLFLFV